MGRRGGKRRRRRDHNNKDQHQHQQVVEKSSGSDDGINSNGNGDRKSRSNCNVLHDTENENEHDSSEENSRINKRQRVDDDDFKNEDKKNSSSVCRNNVQPKIQVTYHGTENKDKIVLPPSPIRTLQLQEDSSDDDDINCSDKAKAHQIRLYSQIWKYLSSSSNKRNNQLMTNPTLIQQHLWSIMMEMNIMNNNNNNEDTSSSSSSSSKTTTTYNIIGIAPTGSGKTLAYGLPTITSKTQSILVLVPTRELVQQVGSVYQKLSKGYQKILRKDQKQETQHQHFKILLIYGGTNDRNRQRQELINISKSDILTTTKTIVVATPGRLLDLLSTSTSSSSSLKTNTDNANNDRSTTPTTTKNVLLFQPGWIILDEADQLAKEGDLGPQVDQILEKVGISSPSAPTITTITVERPKIALISATYPQKVHTMFQKWVGNKYILVEIDSISTTNTNSAVTSTTTNSSSNKKRKFQKSDDDVDVDDDDGDDESVESGRNKKLSLSLEEGTKLTSSNNNNDNNQKLSILSSRIPSNLNQILHVCAEHKKPKKLMHTLKSIYTNDRSNSVASTKESSPSSQSSRSRPLGIIFFSRIEKVKYVSKLLEKELFKNIQLHSQLNTNQRQHNLKMFSCGKYPLLLATDLAARGIDIPSIKFIIQYDFPSNIQQYVHRCGRAGRRSLNHPSNKSINKNNDDETMATAPTATVYSFFTRNLKPMAPDMIKLLEANNAWVDPNLRALVTDKNEEQKTNSIKKKKRKGNTGTQSKKQSSIAHQQHQQQPPPKQPPKNVAASNKNSTSLSDDKIDDSYLSDDDDDDDFKDLAPNRIIFKRASHVSDASSSSDSDDNDDDEK